MTTMIRFITFLALLVGGIGVVKPAAGVLAGLRVDLRSIGVDSFQRRQTTTQVPPQCASVCDPINAMLAANCPPSQCCLASFDTGYFNCFICVGTAANVTDYSEPQSIVDTLYDQCAIAGFQLPVLTFPGQNPTRPLSSVVLPSSSQTAVSAVSFIPPTVVQSVGPATAATSTQAPIPTSSLSSGIRSLETSYFNLFAVAIVGMWFYFEV